jgi:glycosyltransferase involved in cell wall biosynthesis
MMGYQHSSVQSKNALIVSNYSGGYGSEKMLKIIIEGFLGEYNVSLVLKNSSKQEIIKEDFGDDICNFYTEQFNIISVKNKRFSILSLWFWYGKLKILRPDILVVNISLIPEIFLVSALLGIKTFVFIRESLIDYPVLFRYYKKYLNLLNVKIVSNSKYTASMFNGSSLESYILYDTSDVVGLNDKDSLQNKKEYDYINITYLGRLSYRKGIDVLVESVLLLSNKYKINLNIIGSARVGDEEYINNTLKKLYTNKSVKVHEYGFLIDPYYIVKDSRLVLATSTLPETFGLSVLESLSLGVPVIANEIGAYPELIQNEYNGFLYNGTVFDLVEKAQIILDNKDNIPFNSNAYDSSLRFSKRSYLSELRGIIK